MPRAKKTDRAAARRRHRAVAEGSAADMEMDATEPEEARGRPRPAPARPERPSITRAFRESFHPLDLRDDLVTAPALILRSKAVWLPLLVSIVTAGAFVSFKTDLTFIAFQYFVFTMPLGAVFLAGFLAPRSSWLAGLLVGAGTVIIFAISLSTGRLDDLPVFAPENHGALISQAVLASTVGGAFFAATAAWYRRFLRMSNPNRARQQAQTKRSDGRARSSRPQGSTARR